MRKSLYSWVLMFSLELCLGVETKKLDTVSSERFFHLEHIRSINGGEIPNEILSIGLIPQSKQPLKPLSRPIPALHLRKNGYLTNIELSRSRLAQELRCPMRDLRLMDPSFPGHYPAVLSRKNAILIRANNIRAVITANEIFLGEPLQNESNEIAESIQKQMSISTMPFEHIALECCLSQICKSQRTKLEILQPYLRQVLNDLKVAGGRLQKRLDQLLPLKNQLDEMKSTLNGAAKCLNEVLTNDADMAQMYLSERNWRNGRSKRKVMDHEEVEMIFENYLMQLELICSDVLDDENEITNTEEIVEIELDVIRNRILQVELLLSISAFMVAVGALLTGLFGMNLLSHLETNANMFWIVTVGIFTWIICSITLTVWSCKRAGLL